MEDSNVLEKEPLWLYAVYFVVGVAVIVGVGAIIYGIATNPPSSNEDVFLAWLQSPITELKIWQGIILAWVVWGMRLFKK